MIGTARKDNTREEPVAFHVESPFDTKATPNPGELECLLWDYGKAYGHHTGRMINSTSILLLDSVILCICSSSSTCVEKSCFYVCSEEHDAEGTNMVISMVHD